MEPVGIIIDKTLLLNCKFGTQGPFIKNCLQDNRFRLGEDPEEEIIR
jgi:hypothetical protein